MSTPSQVGSKKLRSQPNVIREVRQGERTPKETKGGLHGNARHKGQACPREEMRRASKLKDHS